MGDFVVSGNEMSLMEKKGCFFHENLLGRVLVVEVEWGCCSANLVELNIVLLIPILYTQDE